MTTSFGYESGETSALSLSYSVDYIQTCKFTTTAEQAGVAQSITAHLITRAGYDFVGKAKFALYDSSHNLIAQTEEIIPVADEWNTANFEDPKPEIVGETVYYLAAWSDGTGGKRSNLGYQSGEPQQAVYTNDYLYATESGQYPSPMTTEYSAAYLLSVYCTYEEAVEVTHEGSASGSGVGLGTSLAKLDVLASVLGNGIGLAQSSSYLIIPARASGQGIGLASALSILDVIAQAQGSGVGTGLIDALLDVFAQAAGSGIGLGSTEALIRVLATAAASGEGLGSVITLLAVIAEAVGNGIGEGSTLRVILIIPHIRRKGPDYTLGKVKPSPRNLGTMLDKYTLGRRRY